MPTSPSERRRGSLDRGTPTPLWQQLLGDLRARLASGEFAEEFPGELTLVEQYAVSRHTVREALRELRGEGTVTAARGRRPQLVPVEVLRQVGTLTGLVALPGQGALPGRWHVRLCEVRADGVVAVRLGLEESAPLVHLERILLVDDVPVLVDRAWFDSQTARPLLEVDLSRTALYDELTVHCGVRLTQVREQVHARVPGRGERAVLGLPSGDAAVIVVERTGCSDGRPVEYRRTLVRGDRCAISAVYDDRRRTGPF